METEQLDGGEKGIREWEQNFDRIYFTDGSCEQGDRAGRAGAAFFWSERNGSEGGRGGR